MNKTELERLFDKHLRERGFEKKKATWYRTAEDLLQLINLQKSAFGGQFYLNVGIVPLSMAIDGMPYPKEWECPVGIRASALFHDASPGVERILDLENASLSDAERAEAIATFIGDRLLPFLARVEDQARLRAEIVAGTFRKGMVNLALKRHFDLPDIV